MGEALDIGGDHHFEVGAIRQSRHDLGPDCFRVMRKIETPGLDEASMPGVRKRKARFFSASRNSKPARILQHDPGGQAANRKRPNRALCRRP